MSSNIGKKNIAHKGSGHGVVGPPAMSLVAPPPPPVPTPFVYSAQASDASKTKKKYLVAGKEILVKGSTMSLDPPANQPAQTGGGDVVTHATKNVEYDAEGRRAARILPDGERTSYHYDDLDAFVGVTHDGRRISIDRDALGRERARRATGWQLDSEYDSMDRLQSQRVTAPEAGAGVPRVLAERRYSYDAKGRLTSIDSLHGGMTIYRYDSIDQLVEASRGAMREVFEYDPTGSLVNMLGDLGDVGKRDVWSLAPGNQLKSTDGAKYVNDGRGRRIARVERVDGKDPRENTPRGDERVTTYGWDSKDRLREVVTPEGVRVRITYDAFGRRVRKDVLPKARGLSGTFAEPPVDTGSAARKTVHFLWDGDVLCEEQDSSKEEQRRKRIHVHVPGSFVPVAQVERGEMFGVVNDHLGMPKELVDGAGRVAWRATHGAWGGLFGVARDVGTGEVGYG